MTHSPSPSRSTIGNHSSVVKPFHLAIREDFHLSLTHRQECICYFIRHWDTDYFLSLLQHGEVDGNNGPHTVTWIEYADTLYLVEFIDSTAKIGFSSQVRLSFRKPKNTSIPGYILVKTPPVLTSSPHTGHNPGSPGSESPEQGPAR